MILFNGLSKSQYLDIIASQKLTKTKKDLILFLANKSNDADGACMSYDELSSMFGMSKVHCKRLVRFLVSNGFVDSFYDASIKKMFFKPTLPDDTIERFKSTMDTAGLISPRSKKTVKTNKRESLDSLKDELFDRIRSKYHPARAFLQPVVSKQAFLKECTLVTKPHKKLDKKKQELLLLSEKITSHIKVLSKTDAWIKNDGKYLPGFGNYIRSGAWKSSPVKPKIDSLDELSSFFE